MHGTLIFMIQLVVDGLDIVEMPEESLDQETCISLKIPHVVHLQLCDSELASDPSARKGKSCLFYVKDIVSQPMEATISLHKTLEDRTKVLIGSCDFDLTQMFQNLAKNFADVPSAGNFGSQDAQLDENASTQSLYSFKRDSLVAPISKEPTSESIKGLFPLMAHGEITAFITLAIQASCFGKNVEQTIVVSLPENEAPRLQLAPDCELTKVASEEQECECPCCPSSEDSLEAWPCPSTSSERHNVSASSSCWHMPTDEAETDEFIVEINGNALVMRLAKGHKVIDETSECTKIVDCVPQRQCCSEGTNTPRDPCIPFHPHCCNLPVIKGTLKYPTRLPCCDFCFDPLKEEAKKDPMKKYRKPKSVGIQMSKVMEATPKNGGGSKACPVEPDIEVCQGGWLDPETDAFVLKFGQKKGKHHDVELELRTPKCVEACHAQFNTTGTQVFEEEFEDFKKSQGKKVGKKGAKGKKKKGKK